jgi:hypothetical protein
VARTSSEKAVPFVIDSPQIGEIFASEVIGTGEGLLSNAVLEAGRNVLCGSFYFLYPLIPWIGVMACGYLLGPVMQLEGKARQRLLFRLGAAITLGFIVLRATNLYGDRAPWTAQETLLSTVLSFLNCEKYPPSLLYLMMTLGPALILLGAFEHARGAFARVLATFGQVPFFYYVVHIYLIHGLAVATGFAMTGVLTSTPTIGVSLPGVYLVWLLVLVLLYPICRWFAELKQSGSGRWWSYL